MTDNIYENSIDQDWQELPDNIRKAIKAGWTTGMPPLASALYGRWWQLESWLRTLLYVELRAKIGSDWAKALPEVSEKRQRGETELRYMVTPDAQNLLAYTDASKLFEMTSEHWEIFENTLLSKNVWVGRVEELLAIRNRIGHCRRPHTDDLSRLEQTLRDLNGGAFTAISTFNNQWRVNKDWMDPVTQGWVREQHEDAVRLIKHAERGYDTFFELRYSRRPWATRSDQQTTISGFRGIYGMPFGILEVVGHLNSINFGEILNITVIPFFWCAPIIRLQSLYHSRLWRIPKLLRM